LDDEFKPKDENTYDGEDFDIGFEPRDESEYNSLEFSKQAKPSHYKLKTIDASETKKEIKWDKTDWRKDSSNQKNKINLNDKKSENEKKKDHTHEKVKDSKILDKDYNFKNLIDEKVQNTFKTYYDETGKYANYGKNLRKDFIDWVKKTGTDYDVISKINEIQKNQEITNFIKDKIKNSDFSQQEISNLFNENTLLVSRKTIGNISLKGVYNYNKDAHHQRFDHSLNPEIKENIIKKLGEEVENYNKGEQHDSLYKIAKDFPEISKTTVDKIAKKEISQQVYKNMWPSTSGTVPNETREAIKNRLKEEAQKENPYSLRSISDDFSDASHTYVIDLAKEVYPNKHKDLWPAIGRISNEIKNEIIKTIKDEALKENTRTLRDIHKDFPEVGADTIKRLAKQVIPEDVHDKIWSPLTTEIPKELASKITQTLKHEINKPKPRSLTEIGRHFHVSNEYVRKLAKKTISKQVYEDIWKGPEPITDVIKNNIIKNIIDTKLNISEIAERNGVSSSSVSKISQSEVFQENIDAHRERFPIDDHLEIGNYTHLNLNSLITEVFNDIPYQKYYAEPNIYSNKRRPDGLILEDNNFIHQRLTNVQTGEYLRDKLELNPKNLDHIKSTQFDFTNDISYENLIDKIEKYQSEESLLVIVGTRWYSYNDIKHLPVDDKIKYPENVRVINHNLGADLIGLQGKYRDLYDKIIDFNYNRDLDSLKALYNYDLSSINTHNTKELKKDLIQKGLIQGDFNEYFNFKILNKKEVNEKQLDLDYFLNC